MQHINKLQEILEYKFNDISLLKLALTHRSYNQQNNERMEFVGDGVLDCVMAMNLYNRYPHLSEGGLSKIRAALVNQDTLAEIAIKISLGQYLLLSEGEDRNGGRMRPSILANCVEALFGAVAFDSTIMQAAKVIELLYGDLLDNAESLITKDFKSILQEQLQRAKIDVPIYQLRGVEGPAHNIVFHLECVIPELGIRVLAHGRTKKEASQIAAQKALAELNSFKRY